MVPPTGSAPHGTRPMILDRRPSRSVWPMSVTSRLLRSLGIVVVVSAVAIGAAVYLGKRDLTVPAPSPVASGIDAHAKVMRTVPDVSRDARREAAREIADAIERVYTAAFTRPAD